MKFYLRPLKPSFEGMVSFVVQLDRGTWGDFRIMYLQLTDRIRSTVL